jgi:hypothetical protein
MASMSIVKLELRLYEKTADALHLAHAQRALDELMAEVRQRASDPGLAQSSSEVRRSVATPPPL